MKHLPNANFISIDEEMTGIFLPPSSTSNNSKFRKDDTPAKRYKLLKKIPEHYSILQLGICLFEEKKSKKRRSSRRRKESPKKKPPAAGGAEEVEGKSDDDDENDEDQYEDDREMVSIFDNTNTTVTAAAAAVAAEAKVEGDNTLNDDVDHEGYIVVRCIYQECFVSVLNPL